MPHYPPTRVEEVRETFHGVEVVDPYRWLEDGSAAETRAWVRAQNRLTQQVLSAVPVRPALARRFRALASRDLLPLQSLLPPRVRADGADPRYFEIRRPARAPQPVLYYRDGPRGPPRALVDPAKESRGTTTSILLANPSWDGSKVVFALSVDGSDRTQLRIREARSRRELGLVPDLRYCRVAWRHDGAGLYYSTWPEPTSHATPERARVFFHRLGSPAESDAPIFGEKLPRTEVISDLVLDPQDHDLVILVERLGASSDLYHLDLRRGGEVRPLIAGLGAYFVSDDSMFLRDRRVVGVTEHRAPRRRVVSISLDSPEEAAWRELVPEAQGVLEALSVVGDRMVLRYLEGATHRLRVHAFDGTFLGEIPLPGRGTVVGPPGELEGSEAVFTFSSFDHPTTSYRCSLPRGPLTVLHRSPLPNPRAWLTTRQVRYRSRDGTEVTMFLVHRRRLRPDGRTPTVVEGYGGYGLSYLPTFDLEILPFVRDGGIYAVPNLRGGGEYGKAWHDAGKRELKQNVFDDMIAAVEWLVREGYTDSRHLAIKGISNGGLLVAAVLTQRPELVRAVVCQVPVTDMLRYERFDGGALWVPEYGSAEDPAMFPYLWQYSPYHRVRPGVPYPAVLLTTADTDTRVNPLHARKMAARLQAATSSKLPVLLRTGRHAGHGFGRSVDQTVAQCSDIFAFLYDQLSVEPDAN